MKNITLCGFGSFKGMKASQKENKKERITLTAFKLILKAFLEDRTPCEQFTAPIR